MLSSIIRFAADRSGNFGVLAAVAMMPVMYTVGVAIDYSLIQQERWRLQETADSSAFYAVKELEKAGVSVADLQKTGKQVVEANFMMEGEVGFELDKEKQLVRVTLTKLYEPGFLAIMHPDPIPIAVVSEVEYGQSYHHAKCFIVLDPTSNNALRLNGNPAIDARSCDLQVNSTHREAVDLNGNATLAFNQTCILGGVDGRRSIIGSPDPDCELMNDPFDDLARPAVGECDYTNRSVSANGAVTLQPGVYCGGLAISSRSDVLLQPGLYVIKDGALSVTGSARLRGDGVTFHFVGRNVSFELSGNATFNVKAMASGPLAGFVLYFDPAADTTGVSTMSGSNTLQFEGILYFGNRRLVMNGNGAANTGSPFSVVVANTVTINGNGSISMKADQAATSLKIPDELFSKTIVPRLVK